MKIVILYIILLIFALVGEIKCIVKMINCDWEPIGKAEIVYTVATFTGCGCVVGWINIEDKKPIESPENQ